MTDRVWKRVFLTGLVLGIGAAGGYWLAQQPLSSGSSLAHAEQASSQDKGEVLYWYDPMVPQQKFDQPGKSPFMDMQLVPRYADEGGDSAAVNIDSSITQNLGMRLASVTRGTLANSLEVVGNLTFNTRDIAVVQARSGGFVGQTLATINGLRSVWLDVAVPEAEALGLHSGQVVEARLPAFPGEVLDGTISAILPEANLDSRTLRVRVELANPEGRLRPGLTAQVRLTRAAEQNALFVPTEAVIRTGRRALVMLADGDGRYRPLEVRLGREAEGKIQVVQGLEEGQQVVASGQFLLDSEASLRGILAQGVETTSAPAVQPALHEAEGKVIEIDNASVTLAHGPFKTLGMPGMTMRFPLAEPALGQGIQTGEQIRIGVRETDAGLLVERLDKLEVQP